MTNYTEQIDIDENNIGSNKNNLNLDSLKQNSETIQNNQFYTNQSVPIAPVNVVTSNNADEHHLFPSVIILIIGIFIPIVSLFNLIYIRSKNRIARLCSKISLILFGIYVFIIAIAVLTSR